jgi:hypothetical protein
VQTADTSSTGSSSQTLEQLRTQSILFSKLFVIMGITWIGECIHVQLHGDHSHLEDCSFYSEVPNHIQHAGIRSHASKDQIISCDDSTIK